jgi:outer membrane protein assembly factor BamB
MRIDLVRIVLIGLAIFGLGVGAAPVGSADSASSTYHVDAARDGVVIFSTPFAPPLKQLWSVDFGGPVSYPVVIGNLAIVIAGGPLGTHLAALDIKTGKPVWQKLVYADYRYAFLASDAGILFLANEGGPIEAYRGSDGKHLWATLPPYETHFNAPPVAGNGYLYITGTGSDVSRLYQLNETNGALGWQFEFTGGMAPTLGNNMIFNPVACDVAAIDPVKASLIWNYYSGCEGGGGGIGAYYGGSFYAPYVNLQEGVILKAATGRVIAGLAAGTPAFSGNTAYTVSAMSVVASFVNGGNIRWRFTPKDTLLQPPITINGNVYTLSNTGVLYINDGNTGRLLQSLAIGRGTGTSMAIGDPSTGLGAGQGTLLVPTGSILAAFAP